ncbi:MAG: Mrp/NBP35 family ATP-binding protein, partial [Lachnospiraceae bacterium]|nr:Mrp/NBP35 family ATP-binding protein [Lachnospiraceae bacterium]
VENFSYIKCPDCGKEMRIFGESHVEEAPAELSIPVLGKIPVEPELAKAADAGEFYKTENPYLEKALEALKN